MTDETFPHSPTLNQDTLEPEAVDSRLQDPEETELYPTDMPVPGRAGDGARVGDSRIGDRVGPYRILRRIAQGGMGTVYLAEREDHFKQRVALKMIHPDKVSDAVLQRFYAERQILADLEHPHIARIFDGGATTGTLPFFVMEYVEGEPFDVACGALSLVERLRLFQKVCAAVHHAHRSLIVHRDLKPSNILVTADGEPKLLDFGIAKPLDRDPQDGAEQRRSDPGPMTIAFASPEQLSGDPITIGTDIYSLGVLLYKILTGRHPHHQRDISTEALVNAILHEEPELPSQVATDGFARRLRGDLDAIVLKTLSKKPQERYDSAAQLAEEIQLYLDDRPIRAWPGTWLGRLRKGARRNKLAVAAVVSLLVFSSTVTGLWRHAVEQQVKAEQAKSLAEQTRGFIMDFFKAMKPDRGAGPKVDVKKVLDDGRRSLDEKARDEPLLRAELLGTLGSIYYDLAFHEEALELQLEALEHRRALPLEDPRRLAVDINNLANTYNSLKQHDRAEVLLRESMALMRSADDPEELRFWASLGANLSSQGKPEKALEEYEAALERVATLGLEGHPHTALIYHGLGAVHRKLQNHEAAEHHLRRALSGFQQQDRPSKVAQVKSSLGRVLQAQGKHAEARLVLEETLKLRRHLFGDRNRLTAGSRLRLARLLLDLGDLEAARPLLKDAGDTYAALGDEAKLAEVRQAEARRIELSAHRDTEGPG